MLGIVTMLNNRHDQTAESAGSEAETMDSFSLILSILASGLGGGNLFVRLCYLRQVLRSPLTNIAYEGVAGMVRIIMIAAMFGALSTEVAGLFLLTFLGGLTTGISEVIMQASAPAQEETPVLPITTHTVRYRPRPSPRSDDTSLGSNGVFLASDEASPKSNDTIDSGNDDGTSALPEATHAAPHEFTQIAPLAHHQT